MEDYGILIERWMAILKLKFQMLLPISIMIGLGMVISITPLLLYFEIYLWRRGKIFNPFLKGIKIGFLLWLLIQIFLVIEAGVGIFGIVGGLNALAFVGFLPLQVLDL